MGPILDFSPAAWADYARVVAGDVDDRPAPPLPDDDLRKACPDLSAGDIAGVYRPLARVLDRRVAEVRGTEDRPYLVGVAGGVAAGKSTTSRTLLALIAGCSAGWRVEVATTDGFLYPNRELEARGLTPTKGCPASYDAARLVRFLAEVRAGRPDVRAPVYSHETYDVVPGAVQLFRRPDVLILEGVNVLDTTSATPPFVPDLLDFRIYIDAHEQDLERWYAERFLRLCQVGRRDPAAFYHRFAAMTPPQIEDLARQVWRQVNGPNLREWVEPTRARADLVLEKGPDHAVRRIRLRTR